MWFGDYKQFTVIDKNVVDNVLRFLSFVRVMASKYILGIMGSPRKNGNTAILLQEIMQALGDGVETETVQLSSLNIQGCRGCEQCRAKGKCIILDDMQELYPKIERADAIILASPTYFYNVTALMKAFIERLYCYERFHPQDRSVWSSLNEINGTKFAVSIAVCEQENEYDMGFASEAMDRSLQALGYRLVDSVKVLKVYKEGEVQHHPQALIQAKRAGERLIKMFDLIARNQ